MKTTQEHSVKEIEKGDASQLEIVANSKGLSEDKNNSHEGKDTNISHSSKHLRNFLDLYSIKKVNASGTGYLCDNDDDRDDQFQND